MSALSERGESVHGGSRGLSRGDGTKWGRNLSLALPSSGDRQGLCGSGLRESPRLAAIEEKINRRADYLEAARLRSMACDIEADLHRRCRTKDAGKAFGRAVAASCEMERREKLLDEAVDEWMEAWNGSA